MNKFYSDIKGCPIYSQAEGQLVGMVHDLIINPDNGKIEAFWIKPATLPIDHAIILGDSILSWGKKIYVKDEKEVLMADDIIRITDILSRNCLFIGNTVVNEGRKVLGAVYDLDFDTKKLYLRTIYSAYTFLSFKYGKRAFSFDSIIEVFPDRILVKDLNPVEIKSVELGKGPLVDA